MEPREHDEPLSTVLQSWSIKEAVPPRFQEQVWQRIARVEPSTPAVIWSAFLNWLDAALPRKAPAAAFVTILLLAGVVGGSWRARQTSERWENALASRYVQMVDPFQAPH